MGPRKGPQMKYKKSENLKWDLKEEIVKHGRWSYQNPISRLDEILLKWDPKRKWEPKDKLKGDPKKEMGHF
jgi:hypothetical protein